MLRHNYGHKDLGEEALRYFGDQILKPGSIDSFLISIKADLLKKIIFESINEKRGEGHDSGADIDSLIKEYNSIFNTHYDYGHLRDKERDLMSEIFEIDSDVTDSEISDKLKAEGINFDYKYQKEIIGRISGYYTFNIKQENDIFTQQVVDIIGAKPLDVEKVGQNYILYYHYLDLDTASFSEDTAYLGKYKFEVNTIMLHRYEIRVIVPSKDIEEIHDSSKPKKRSLGNLFGLIGKKSST